MFIPFHQLPAHARVWVYQANRSLSEVEVQYVQENLSLKINQWAAHGASLLASAKVFYNRFVVVGLDEMQNAASGCSIDASTHWLKDLGQTLGIDFFNRSLLFWQNETLHSAEIPQLKAFIKEGKITPHTIVFNNLVPTIQAFEQQWQLKASDSWLKNRFMVLNEG